MCIINVPCQLVIIVYLFILKFVIPHSYFPVEMPRCATAPLHPPPPPPPPPHPPTLLENVPLKSEVMLQRFPKVYNLLSYGSVRRVQQIF